jgi:uncharacterized protein YndB with AHSA1/START domain
MSITQDASGRRSVHVEVEVSGTPDEVWQAIATGPGISAWFVPAKFELGDGQPTALTLDFGSGIVSTSTVTAWAPPHRWSAQSNGWLPGSPPIANEWTIDARADGTCLVRVAHSLVASSGDWDSQLEGTEAGWPAFLRTLQLYLRHFRGQRSAVMKCMLPVAATEAQAWATLTSALGLKGLHVGQHGAAPAGVPAFSGVVEYAHEAPFDALLRVDQPCPGVAALGTVYCGDQTMVGLNFYLYGDSAADTVARESARWEAWMQQRFPAPPGPAAGT